MDMERKKKTLILLSERGSILHFVSLSMLFICDDTPVFMIGSYGINDISLERYRDQYECKFEPEQSWQEMNRGKLSKKQRRK